MAVVTAFPMLSELALAHPTPAQWLSKDPALHSRGSLPESLFQTSTLPVVSFLGYLPFLTPVTSVLALL